MSQIIHLVEEASASKAPIAKLADKVSGIFVPVVISIAVITIIVWLLLGKGISFALSMGISVLVISCPCALGIGNTDCHNGRYRQGRAVRNTYKNQPKSLENSTSGWYGRT